MTVGDVVAELRELEARIARMEEVLAKIAEGDLDQKIQVSETMEDAFTNLEIGVNFMAADLRRFAKAKEDRETQLLQQSQELHEKLETIAAQRHAISEMSTPIIEIWQEVLCLPLVGTFDSARSSQMTERLLERLSHSKARAVIIDITGIAVMDTQTADHFIRLAKSVRLLGTEPLITGISGEIARTLTHSGVEIQGIRTFRNLQQALRALVGR